MRTFVQHNFKWIISRIKMEVLTIKMLFQRVYCHFTVRCVSVSKPLNPVRIYFPALREERLSPKTSWDCSMHVNQPNEQCQLGCQPRNSVFYLLSVERVCSLFLFTDFLLQYRLKMMDLAVF